MLYVCDDGNCEVTIEADSAKEAAEEYVEDGTRSNHGRTFWVAVSVTPIDPETEEEIGDQEWITVAVHPDEPCCDAPDDYAHEWESPHDVVGGLRENPGVWGHGGGVLIYEVCERCGALMITDTWAQDPDSGVQGLTSVHYVTDPAEIRAELGT